MVFLRSKIKHALKSKSQFWVKETRHKKVHSYKTLENEHTNPQWQKADQWLFLQGVNSEGWTTMGTGKLLQRSSVSCLENPRDGEAWWAAVDGVAQSQTWLKRPSSSSSSVSRSVVLDSVRPHGLWPTRLLCPWDSPRKNTGVDCHSLLQRIFPIQESNLGLLHCRQIL